MATVWTDISVSAFYGDYNGYMRYANQLLNIAGTASSSSPNGMRVFSIEPEKNYRVTMQMRNRFRLCCVANLTNGQTAANYVIDASDLNDATDQNGAEHTLEITSQAGQVFLCVGAWSSGASETLFNTLDTIVVEELRETYTVTFEDWDGSVLKSQTVASGESATPPEEPVRAEHTFTGWSGDYANITADVTITAQYVAGSLYTVTFADWDGAVLKTEQVAPGDAATPPTSPTRAGYTFDGWSGSYESITTNTTITASYTILSFTVVFNDWDGSTLSTQTVNYGADAVPPTEPSRNGYLFQGWDGSYTNVTADAAITATYSIDPATLTGVEVTALPSKMEYKRGEDFDSAGMAVTAIYSVAGNVIIADYSLSGFDSSVSGSCTITISYGGFSDSFAITVLPNTVSEECGTPNLSDVIATLDLDTGAVTITGTGAIKDYDYKIGGYSGILKDYQGSVITSITICEGITLIGAFAFRSTVNAATVVLPNGLQVIKNHAFIYCYNLRSIDIPDSVVQLGPDAFYGCESLASVTFPDGLATIEEYAFSKTAITAIAFSANSLLSSIKKYAFEQCEKLAAITLPDSLTEIGPWAFYRTALTSVEIPSAVISIGEAAFIQCCSLASIILHQGLVTIANRTFNNTAIVSLEIPDTVTSIGAGVCGSCAQLETVYIPASINSLSSNAFSDCAKLTRIFVDKDYDTIAGAPWGASNADVIWNNAVQEIGSPNAADVIATVDRITGELVISGTGATADFTDRALFEAYLSYLNSVAVEEGVTALGAGIFAGYPASAVSLPDSLTAIGEGAFSQSSFTNLAIPSGVASIGANAFKGSSLAQEIVLPQTLTSLGISAFDSCPAVTAFNIPGSLAEVPLNAFAGCAVLSMVNIGNGVSNISPLAFNGDTKIALVIIDDTLDAIEGAPWGAMKANVVWLRNPMTVRWLSWDDAVLKTESVYYLDAASPPAVPEREGYVFSGWSIAYNCILSDSDIYAQYTQKGFFIVEFRDCDETMLKREYVLRNMAATPPIAPARAGYNFTGWSCDFSVIAEDLTVYAQYSARNDAFTVAFNNWDGTSLKTESVAYGQSAAAPAPPERTGYYFLSWSLSFRHVTSDIVTTAQYRELRTRLAAEVFSGQVKVGEIQKVTGCSVSRKLNGECILSLSTLSPFCQFVQPQHKLEIDGLIFDIVAIEKRIFSGICQTTVTGEHISYILNNEEYEIDELYFTGSPADCLAILLSGTPFSVGTVDFNGEVTLKINKADTTRRDAVMQLLALCGGEIEYDGYSIGIRSHIGSSERVRLMDSLNVSDISMSQDVRRGMENYSIELFKRVALSVGDEVNIAFAPLGINTNKRITGIVYNPFDVYSVDITLGGYKPTLSDTLYTIAKQAARNTYETQNILDLFQTLDEKVDSLAEAANKKIPDVDKSDAIKDVEEDITDMKEKLDELDEYSGVRVESVTALPGIPEANTIYLIQGEVSVE